MSVIGEFTVPSESFLLEDTLRKVPEMVVELQQVVAHSHDKLVPFFWVHHGDKDAFDTAVRNDSTLRDVVLLDEFEEGTSYRGTWTENASGVAYAYIEAGATILDATGQDGTWTLRMRFDDDGDLTDFHRFCREEEIPFELTQLYRPSQPMGGGQYGLTPGQRETLVEALQRGFYDVPRAVNMTELADTLEVTQQSLSSRLRRAHATLVENTLVVSDEENTSATNDSF